MFTSYDKFNTAYSDYNFNYAYSYSNITFHKLSPCKDMCLLKTYVYDSKDQTHLDFKLCMQLSVE